MEHSHELLGRERELAELAEAVRPGRVVAILGPPGVGKSALLRAYAASRPAASVFVRVSTGDDVGALLLRLARSIGIEAQAPAVPHVAQRLGPRVVFFDDAELSLESVQAVLASLRAASPSLTAVLTAMTPIEGAHGAPLAPLEVGDATREGPAIALFRRRVAALGYALPSEASRDVAMLVEGLGGLPLAIELAAARSLVVSPRELFEDLATRSLRTGSAGLAAKMDVLCKSAWRDLARSQRVILVACSFFPAGVSARTLAVVLGEARAPALVDDLATLRTRSLLFGDLRGDELRLRLPVPMLAHVERRAEKDGATPALLRAVARHWARRCEAFVESSLAGGEDETALAEELRAEAANLAFIRARTDDPRRRSFLSCGVALGLATAPARALDVLAEAISATSSPMSAAEAWALEFAATLERYRGNLRQSEERLVSLKRVTKIAGLVPKREARWRSSAAVRALAGLANGKSYVDAWPEAGRLLERAVRRCERTRSPLLFRLLPMLAAVHFNLDELEQSRTLLERARAGQVARGDKALLAVSTISLGIVALTDGRLVEARAHLEQGGFEAERRGDPQWHAVAQSYLARLVQEEGDPRAASAAFDAARARLAELGAKRALGLTSLHAAACAVELGDLGRALDVCRSSLDLLPDEYRSLANAILAHVARERGEGASAAAHAELARRAVTKRTRPSLRLAAEILLANDEGAAKKIAAASGREEHVDVRLALRLVARRASARSPEASLEIEASCAWFVAPGSAARVSLARRKPLRRILHALVSARTVRPGDPVELGELVRVGWPGESVLEKAASDRVYAAIATLRRLGLRDQLVREGNGYMLARAWRVDLVGDLAAAPAAES